MIKNIIENVNGYCEGMRQSMEVRKQAVDFIKKNYVSGSEVYNSAMKQCQATFSSATRPLKQGYIDAITKEIAETKSRLAEVVGTEVPDELTKIIPMVSSMTSFEKQTILEKYSNNYLAQKMLHQTMGQDFRTVESIIDDVNDLVKQLSKITHSPLDSYDTKLMQNGKWIDNVSDEVQNFIDKYSMKGGE